MTRLVVGLGNPGPAYESTPHNAGFLVVELLAENLRASYRKDVHGARVASVWVGDEEIVLAQPQTFMNVSGKSVEKLVDAYGVEVPETIVVHDDIDLPWGTVRVKRGGGHGGHNGLRSLNERLGTGDYLRVRIGVGRPPGRMDPAEWVLRPLKGERWEEFASVIPAAAQAVMHILERGADTAMQEYNAG